MKNLQVHLLHHVTSEILNIFLSDRASPLNTMEGIMRRQNSD